jgi:hypothetical protein
LYPTTPTESEQGKDHEQGKRDNGHKRSFH